MRVKEFDIARGFTVFIMPGVHVLMLYGNDPAKSSWLATIFGFLAEGPGAPLFMVLMGASFCFSSHTTWPQVLKRSALLLIAGYVLNFLKFTLLQITGLMPADFLAGYGIAPGRTGITTLLLVGDILQFAAIALVILRLIFALPRPYLVALIVCIFVIVVSPVHFSVAGHFYPADLFVGKSPLIFFPVFPWLAYPVAGLCTAYIVKNTQHPFIFLRNIGIVLCVAACITAKCTGDALMANFYRSAPPSTLFHISVVLVWLYLIHILYGQPFFTRTCSFFGWLSKHITSIYILQWIIVFWCLPAAGYAHNGIWQTITWMIILTAVTFSLRRALEFIKIKRSVHARAI